VSSIVSVLKNEFLIMVPLWMLFWLESCRKSR